MKNIHVFIKLCLLTMWWLTGTVVAADLGRVEATELTPRSPVAIKMIMKTEQALSPAAEFRIVFAPDFDVSGVVMAGSRTALGGFTALAKDSVVTVRRSGLGESIAAGEEFDLILASVKLPHVIEDSYRFEVKVIDDGRVLSDRVFNLALTRMGE